MRLFSKWVLWSGVAVLLSANGYAQTDICRPASPNVPNESKVELARIQSEERARLAALRSNWGVNLIPLKNVPTPTSLQPLCIFDIEVVPDVASKLVGIRAPKELMPAIEEALKKLDVAPQPAKTIDLAAYVLVVADALKPGLMPLPQELQGVANQLKGLVPNGTLYLFDTVIARGVENTLLQIAGNTSLTTVLSVREGGPATVRLGSLRVDVQNKQSLGRATFSTSIDVPIGSYVVVGKVSMFPNADPGGKEIAILVMTAKISS